MRCDDTSFGIFPGEARGEINNFTTPPTFVLTRNESESPRARIRRKAPGSRRRGRQVFVHPKEGGAVLNTENCEQWKRSISEVVGGGAELTTKRYGEDDGRTDERGERKTDFLARDDANQRLTRCNRFCVEWRKSCWSDLHRRQSSERNPHMQPRTVLPREGNYS